MRAIASKTVSGFVFAACLVAGLSVRAMGPAEVEAVPEPEWAGDVVWGHQLGTPNYEQPTGLATDGVGNVLIGYSNVTVKYSPQGKRLQTRELPALDPYRWISTVAWGPGGSFLIASYMDIDLYAVEHSVAKYSAAGNRLWTRQQYGRADSMVTDAAGNVLIAGITSYRWSDAFVDKYSPAGELLWTRTLDGSGFGDHVNAGGVATDAVGNVFIAGSASIYGDGVSYAFVAKYQADGMLRWRRWLALGTTSGPVATDAAGNVVMVGTCSGTEEGDRDAFVAKYSPAGKRLWRRQFGTAEYDGASGVATDPAGNIVIAGSTGGSLVWGDRDAFVAKYSPAGKRLWTRQFGTPKGDFASRVTTDVAGNIVIAGFTEGSLAGPNRGGEDVFILELRP